MSDQSQTATNKQSEPSLCKQGCGFFGNAATGGFCSKCWRDAQKTKSAVAAANVAPPSPEPICTKVVEKTAPLTVEVTETTLETSTETPKSAVATDTSETTITETPAPTESAPAAAANAPAKKKKKKKTSYKNMMASMMKEKAHSTDKDNAKDNAIRKVTGGGAFSKIDKI